MQQAKKTEGLKSQSEKIENGLLNVVRAWHESVWRSDWQTEWRNILLSYYLDKLHTCEISALLEVFSNNKPNFYKKYIDKDEE